MPRFTPGSCRRWLALPAGLVLGVAASLAAETMPPPLEESAEEPVRYVGTETTDKRFYDGGLPHAVGVHAYQAYRANRAAPPEGGRVGWTYSHAPMLTYWKDRFYLQYLRNLKEEHVPPARTLLTTSRDGRHWTTSKIWAQRTGSTWVVG